LSDNLSSFMQRIGYSFHDITLLEQALTHSSYLQEHNERLEFLGDAVLELIVSADLFGRYPDHPEGVLTRMRARLVERSALLMTAQIWDIAPLMRVGKGERDSNGLPRADSVIANGVEAVIGAVYIDGGYLASQKVVEDAWLNRLTSVLALPAIDAKTALQEWTQSHEMGLPEYHYNDLGVGNSSRFCVSCQVKGRVWGQGRGGRKKDAEQQAAKKTLSQLMQVF